MSDMVKTDGPDPAMMVPCIIPFGQRMVTLATGLREGHAFMVVRAVSDNFAGSDDAIGAWQESEASAGPAWFLHFATPESAHGIADVIRELGDAFQANLISDNTDSR